MRKSYTIVLAAIMMLAVAASGFAFEWISFPNTQTDMSVQVSAGYGHLLVVPVGILPVGAAFEMNLPFLDGLSAGAGLGIVSISYNPDGDLYDATALTAGFGAYGKYIFLSEEQMEEMIGLPLIVGAAAGFGWQFEAISADVAGYADFGYQALAVAVVGYKAEKWFATAYTGWIDQSFSGSAEFAFSLTDTMHVGLFYVPLIGLGATFTTQF